MKNLLLFLLFFQILLLNAQEALYVSAKNGLIVRSEPNKNGNRVGKLGYAEKLVSFQHTNRYDQIVDNGNVIQGEWYHISGNDINSKPIEGYVFNGFLTSDKLKKKSKIKFEGFTIEFEDITLWDSEKTLSEIQKDTVLLHCDLSENLENKTLQIKNNTLKKIELYQRYENSITIMDEGPHCDLTDWKHYDSDWKKIPFIKKENAFKTLKYNTTDSAKFIPIQIKELRNAVEKHCGERWSNLITKIKNVTEYPSGVSRSKIFIKIVTTDKNNKVSEKIIEFVIPMGC